MAQKLLFGLVGVIVLAIAGSLFLFADNPVSPEPDRSTAPSPSIDSELPELSAFVEEARGLEFKTELRLAVLSEPAFREELNKRAMDRRATGRLETVLNVLGLLPSGADASALRAPSDPAAAFYDPARDELMTTKELTASARKVLVHELTHALDDQYFGIDRDISGDQAAAAFDALVEGSAMRVERLYVASLRPGQREEITSREEEVSAPSAVEQLVGFAKLFGPPFVETLAEESPDRLNRAFSSPPTTSEQVLDPARYLAGDAPQTVGRPHTEGAATDEGEFGQLLLQLMLESKLDPAVAKEAASGWDGDRYATWRSPDGRTCVRARFAADGPEDSRQLQAALAGWVDRVTDREVDSAGLLLKACERRAAHGDAEPSGDSSR